MIPPALTKEAWASIAAGNGLPYAYGSSILDDIGMLEGADIPASIAYLNAALPDGDPRKITWGMVDDIRSTANGIERMAALVRPDATTTAEIARLRGHADAIASYLPPRETAEPRLDKCGCPMVEIMRGEWKTMHVITCTLLPREVKP